MLHGALGNTGIAVSKITLGTTYFGSATPEEDAFAILDLFVEAGDDRGVERVSAEHGYSCVKQVWLIPETDQGKIVLLWKPRFQRRARSFFPVRFVVNLASGRETHSTQRWRVGALC
jgi:hypothetical protein